MARKQQTGGGGLSGERRGRGRTSVHRRSGRAPRRVRAGRHTIHHAAHVVNAAPSHTAPSAQRPAAGSVWSGVVGVASSGPLRALVTDHSQAGATLALTGAEQALLRDALWAWGAARDQLANRAWRRPGGLTRMAGL